MTDDAGELWDRPGGLLHGLGSCLFDGSGELRAVGHDPRVVGWNYTLVSCTVGLLLSYCIYPGPYDSILQLSNYSSPSPSYYNTLI